MSSTIPTIEPSEITRATTVQWKVYFGDYPPSEYTLYYYFIREGRRIAKPGTDNGDGYHLISFTPTEAEEFRPGEYAWQAVAKAGDEAHLVRQGRIAVKESFEKATAGHDPRSHAKKMLDAIEAALESRASSTQLAYTLPNGYSISHASHDELARFRARYRSEYLAELRRERRRAGKSVGSVKVRFTG